MEVKFIFLELLGRVFEIRLQEVHKDGRRGCILAVLNPRVDDAFLKDLR